MEAAQVAAVRRVEDGMIGMVICVGRCSVEIVERGGGWSRIYFSGGDVGDGLVYVRVDERGLEEWRFGLGRARVGKVWRLGEFELGGIVGCGGGGRVFMVRGGDGERFAMKRIEKRGVLESGKVCGHVGSERRVMEVVGRRRFLLEMVFAFQTRRYLFIGTQYCEGGDLGGFLKGKGGIVEEGIVRGIAAEVVLGLECLHGLGIVYRDLKLENILIGGDGHVRIGDYGLAKGLGESGRTGSICGTRNYMAPEILSGRRYGKEVDWWSLGVMLYRMVCGRFPFEGRRTKEVFEGIRWGTVRWPGWLSGAMKELLEGLLEKEGGRRFGLEEVKRHAFFVGVDWDAVANGETGRVVDVVQGKIGLVDRKELEDDEVVDINDLLVGFEFGGIPNDRDKQPPLLITRKTSNNFLQRIASIDMLK